VSARIIVVDHDLELLRSVDGLLRKFGALAEVSSNFSVALGVISAANARGEPFDVLVADVGGPACSGFDLAVVLKHDRIAPEHLVFMSSVVDDERREKASVLGGVLFDKEAELHEMVVVVAALTGAVPRIHS
jgi:DNA-binding response OmpR family regulator